MRQHYYFLYTKAISEMGNMMEMVVMNTMIFTATKSTTWLVAVLAARVIGGIVSSLFSGVISDRFNRRHLMIYSDMIRGTFILILCFSPNPILFILAAFLLGIFGSVFSISFSAEVPHIFGENKILEINALISRLSAISMVLGFFTSALLSNVVSYKVIIMADSFSFFLSSFVLLLFKWESIEKKGGIPSWLQVFSDLKEVKPYIRCNKILMVIFFVFLFQTFAASSQNVGIPMLSQELSPKHMTFYQGLIWGFWGIGSVLSTLLIPRMKRLKQNLDFIYLVFTLLASVGFILMLSNRVIEFILLFSFFTGMSDAGSGTYFSTIVQKTENEIRGRIFGVANFLRGLGYTLGFIATSILLKVLNMPELVWIFHGGMIAVCLLMFVNLLSKKTKPLIESKIY